MDRVERVAYNALPGTITPSMWQHQYLQLANELNAAYGEKEHSWNADGPDSTGMGVEPNFGCCTANFNQGWPKLATNTIFTYDVDAAEKRQPQQAADGAADRAADGLDMGIMGSDSESQRSLTGIAIGIFLPSSATIAIPAGGASRSAPVHVAVTVETEVGSLIMLAHWHTPTAFYGRSFLG